VAGWLQGRSRCGQLAPNPIDGTGSDGDGGRPWESKRYPTCVSGECPACLPGVCQVACLGLAFITEGLSVRPKSGQASSHIRRCRHPRTSRCRVMYARPRRTPDGSAGWICPNPVRRCKPKRPVAGCPGLRTASDCDILSPVRPLRAIGSFSDANRRRHNSR